MTRVLYFISGSFFIALGVFFYFVFANPSLDGVQVLTVYRMLGAAYFGLGAMAWFIRPQRAVSFGLAITQLLMASTLVPAILSQYLNDPNTTYFVWMLAGVQALLGVLNLLFLPRREL